MEAWMKDLGVEHVCMESTGKYSLPIYRHLEKHGFQPIITNPKYVSQVKGQKTDERDAIHMANLFRMGLVTPSIIPSEELQDIRDLSRLKIKLTEDRTREKNRFQNALETCGIRLGNVVDDVFGKTGLAIAKYLVYTPENMVKDENIIALIDPRCHAAKEDILASVAGCQISAAKRSLMKTLLGVLQDLDEHINELSVALDEAVANYEEDICNMMTVPGLARSSAISILAEVGNYMTLWSGVDQLVSWNGLCPANNESAGKKKSTKIGKGGHYLKPILVQCALNAIRTKDGYYRNKYDRIASRTGKKKAIIAICRMLMRSIYFILRDKVCWLPKDIQSAGKKSGCKDELEKALDILRKNGASDDALMVIMEQCGVLKTA
jgi:transposase